MKIENNNSKKSHFKRNFFAIIFILTAASTSFVYYYAQKPAKGISKNSQQDQKNDLKEMAVPKAFTGEYVSFLYDNTYILKTHDVATTKEAVVLEQAYLTQASAISKKIGVTVRNLPSRLLEDCPDYKIRIESPNKYKKENFNIKKNNGVSFEVMEGTFEKTFFLQHEDYLAIITLTAPSIGDAASSNEIENIVESFFWLK